MLEKRWLVIWNQFEFQASLDCLRFDGNETGILLLPAGMHLPETYMRATFMVRSFDFSEQICSLGSFLHVREYP
jgi:hypothetical protein